MLEQNNALRNISTVALLMTLWQASSSISKLPFIPSPIAVFHNTCDIFLDTIIIHALYSLWRISAGIIISTLIGTSLGIFMGRSKRLDNMLSPAVYLLYPIPKVALLPLVMLFFGLGEMSKIIMIVMIALFQVILSSRDAVKNIPDETFHSLISLGAGRLYILRKVILPASLPPLLSSLRICLGTALSVLFFTETFGTRYGMGYYIMDSWTRINYVDMFSGILVLSIMGLSIFLIVDFLEDIFCSWKR